MAFERSWLDVPIQLFTANGGANGLVTVASTSGFKVKQTVTLSSLTKPNLNLQVKRVLSPTSMIVGPVDQNIDKVSNISLYTTADSASVYASIQKRPGITLEDRKRAVYEEEPTVAERNVLVDEWGRFYRANNPLPVQLSDGSINIGTVQANLEVQLTAKDNDPTAGKIHDSIRIGDGINEMAVNADGSINVGFSPSPSNNASVNNIYNEVSALASGSEVTLVTYTVLPGIATSLLERIEVSGENIARYTILKNGVNIAKKWTYFGGGLNAEIMIAPKGEEG